MNTIASLCEELKQKRKPRVGRLDKPVAFWSEPDRFNDEIINAFVIILKTKGCSWASESGCSMCGYFNDSAFVDISDDDLLSQFNTAMQSYRDEPVVKIFTSGSFFDTNEISKNVRDKIFTDLSDKTKKTAVESRPEYIKKEILDELAVSLSTMLLEVGIGLESSNDDIREKHVNKGFTFQEYKDSSKLLKSYNHLIKTYVLVKPPFLSEQQAIKDCINTIEQVKDITDTISLNPTNVQKGTLVQYLWNRRYYRPPWLWSVIEILRQGSSITKKRLQCDVAGGGSIRGAHNCKNCDKLALNTIRHFSLSQNPNDLDNIECSCKKQWEDQLSLEQISFGSLIDMQRGLIP
ncbi:TIGR01210 family radical SAM protein [Thermoplasmatales archaeon ex4572_165]|nr:MAG: TIGR01210 family radical SAM protein [Thermoplasmatales archaeon ex4572_165]